MKKILFVLVAVTIQGLGFKALALELNYSAKSEMSDNPFLAYGYNPKTKVITGYLAALRTAPGRTDDCKLVFKADGKRLAVKYLEEAWVSKSGNQPDGSAQITTEKGEPFLKFSKASLGGDCDWILPFNVGPLVLDGPDEVAVRMKVSNAGNWIGVYVVNAEQAKFHGQADNASVQKAYVVKGDVIYVFDERPGWYFVRYQNGSRKTVGWIKKTDTVQP